MIEKKKNMYDKKKHDKTTENKSYTTKSLDHGWELEEHNDIVESKI